MTPSLLIITQAFISNQDGVTLHPDLFLWQQQLTSRKKVWFQCAERTPVEWYALLQGVDATALLAGRVDNLSDNISQCWSVTPYHAMLGRDSVRLYPEGLFTWSEADATWLCDTLNPLLGEEGMSLHHHGAALLLGCQEPLDANPLSFAAISGKAMPNRHHEGADGGRLNRLIAEIQMVLHQQQPEQRQAGEVEISGLWFSNPVAWPQNPEEKNYGVATRNPHLAAMVDGRNAAVIISEAERVEGLLKGSSPLPKHVVLAGEGYALLLTKSLLPRIGAVLCSPKSSKPESELLAYARAWL
ncbi:hypothetical protein Ga0123462_1357 [Mariprofundus ferrinatatus]|uniref:Uncharacterized protein n=1 Tax=Mariprofundus ferrinatatus TaxID=1921087 RepID=A0A2K8L4H0_9PROT|nr:threonine synthase [Mariprofundus ferrinatatus]ATX82220.1 hypothetical protein Ga0123462_1357 [Mariprofundus ferrinatatus]